MGTPKTVRKNVWITEIPKNLRNNLIPHQPVKNDYSKNKTSIITRNIIKL